MSGLAALSPLGGRSGQGYDIELAAVSAVDGHRSGGPVQELLVLLGKDCLAADPVPGEGPMVVTATRCDQAKLIRDVLKPGPCRRVLIRMVHLDPGQPGFGKTGEDIVGNCPAVPA